MSEASPGTGGAYEGDILAASSPGAGQVEVDMVVVGVDGEAVGRVKEVREADFLLERPLGHGLYVPYRAVLATPTPGDRVRGGPAGPAEVVLNVSAAHLDEQHWPRA
jgi:hypothetical protein